MLFHFLFAFFGLVALLPMMAQCQQATVDELGELELLNDPELLQAMEIFASMSPEEMEETMEEVKEMLGDDPATLAAIEQVKQQVTDMKSINHSLADLIAKDEVAAATQDALELLGKADLTTWETIWNRQSDILEAVIKSGQMSEDDAIRFKSSPEEWKEELTFIWNELQKQAAEAS